MGGTSSRAARSASSGCSQASNGAASPAGPGSAGRTGSGAAKLPAKSRSPTAGATAWLASVAIAAGDSGSASGVTSHRPSGRPPSQKTSCMPTRSGSRGTGISGTARSTCTMRQRRASVAHAAPPARAAAARRRSARPAGATVRTHRSRPTDAAGELGEHQVDGRRIAARTRGARAGGRHVRPTSNQAPELCALRRLGHVRLGNERHEAEAPRPELVPQPRVLAAMLVQHQAARLRHDRMAAPAPGGRRCRGRRRRAAARRCRAPRRSRRARTGRRGETPCCSLRRRCRGRRDRRRIARERAPEADAAERLTEASQRSNSTCARVASSSGRTGPVIAAASGCAVHASTKPSSHPDRRPRRRRSRPGSRRSPSRRPRLRAKSSPAIGSRRSGRPAPGPRPRRAAVRRRVVHDEDLEPGARGRRARATRPATSGTARAASARSCVQTTAVTGGARARLRRLRETARAGCAPRAPRRAPPVRAERPPHPARARAGGSVAQDEGDRRHRDGP